eukprot:CAMPEP_0113637134 /NCGR_PEP_ID=MMETSP0017_2-20120614/19428_1 /TAXON_ID=2856 /ORGANISM="Cylindrotheca closterium" /LENGTH=383 /DNA_ID=CAMNT_0000548129 /DNA_START=84 /DNA_END=1235 /DNA_ORIENTATION=+ /assembly_acc=CAM_ASM_000147
MKEKRKFLSRKQSSLHLEDKHHSLLGIFFILLGAFSFSVMFLFVKLMKDANTFTLVFYRAVCEIAIAVAELKRSQKSLLGPPEVRLYLVIRASTGAIAVCAFFYGIQMLPLPDAVTLQFITPAFSAAFAVCLVGEPWKLLDMIGSVVCLTGVAFVAHPTWLFGTPTGTDVDTNAAYASEDASEDEPISIVSEDVALEQKTMAVLVSLGGAATAGLAYVMVRKIGDRASAVHMVLYFGALSIPITLIGSAYLVGEWRIWGKEMLSLTDACLLLVIGFSSYAGQFFTNLGLQHETAATATLATSTQIVWTYIFELVFLHEALDAWSLAGSGLILGYMMVVAVLKLLRESEYIPTEETELLPFADEAESGVKEQYDTHSTHSRHNA